MPSNRGYILVFLVMVTLPETTLRHFFRQLSNGLKVLNAEKILHRDLKPQNIFLHTQNSASVKRDTPCQNILLKIGDFGLSKKTTTGRWSNTRCGTLTFMAPEVLDNSSIRDGSTELHRSKADLWSLGLIFYASLCGRKTVIDLVPSIDTREFLGPRQLNLFHEMHDQMEQRAASLTPQVGSEELRNFLCGMLQRDFTERMSFTQFMEHPFLASNTCDGNKDTYAPDPNDFVTRIADNSDDTKLVVTSISVPIAEFPYSDYQKVVEIHTGAIADESKIPQRWEVFNHRGNYMVTRAFCRWEQVFHGTITCEGIGIWRNKNSKGRRIAFIEIFQQYLVHLCKKNLVDEEKMIKALNEEHNLGQREKADIVFSIRDPKFETVGVTHGARP